MATSSTFEKDAERFVAEAGGARATSEPIDDEPMPRTLGRYVLLRRIARGGMGEVFLAATIGLEGAERPVVVKIIRRDHAKDPSFIARFLDEARVQAQLSHSGVAQVLDAAIDESTGEPYAVVEHVEGKSLGDLRARAMQLGQRFAWFDAVSVGSLIAEALAFVHERQDPAGRALAIVHRDLSPQNVMVSYSGDVKIIDFGTARGQNRRCHTVAGVVFAKPGYVAPEVANGDSGDARVDLYALGVMLWELCAGRRFLSGEAADHLAAVAKNERNLPPIAADVGAPAELDAILARLTAFEREERYPLARHAARDLAKLLTAAPPLATGERGVRARVAELTRRFFPGEPGRTRREFARLVVAARALRAAPAPRDSAPSAPPAPPSRPGAGRAVDDIDDPTLLPGTRYRLVREIGRGASSVVHEAEHADLGRRVALKILSPEHSSSPEFAERFRREARALSSLSHEGLVALHDFGAAADGRLFCVMELCEGETLDSLSSRDGALPWRDALRVARRALAALEVAHGAGLVHRDIKPQNLFLTLDGAVKILDFGLARAEGDTLDEPRTAMGEVTLYGTPEYMAPEQASAGRVDARADLYALGCVLYELVTGRLPFVAKSAVALLDAKAKGSPERPRDRAPSRDIPAAVDELVLRAIARHPSARFQSAAEMAAAVDAALAAPERRRRVGRALGFVAFAGAMLCAAGLLLAGTPRPRAAFAGFVAARRPQPVAVVAPPVVAAPVVAPAAPEPPPELTEADLAAADLAVAAYPPETRVVAAIDEDADDAATEDLPAVAIDKGAKAGKGARPAHARGGKRAKATPSSEKSASAEPAPAVAITVIYEPGEPAAEKPAKAAKKAKDASPRHKRNGRVAQRPE